MISRHKTGNLTEKQNKLSETGLAHNAAFRAHHHSHSSWQPYQLAALPTFVSVPASSIHITLLQHASDIYQCGFAEQFVAMYQISDCHVEVCCSAAPVGDLCERINSQNFLQQQSPQNDCSNLAVFSLLT